MLDREKGVMGEWETQKEKEWEWQGDCFILFPAKLFFTFEAIKQWIWIWERVCVCVCVCVYRKRIRGGTSANIYTNIEFIKKWEEL